MNRPEMLKIFEMQYGRFFFLKGLAQNDFLVCKVIPFNDCYVICQNRSIPMNKHNIANKACFA